jgi:hypothetical protein
MPVDSMNDELARPKRKKRRYARYWDWYIKPLKEVGAVKDLLETMQLRGEVAYHSAAIVEDDPPDCTVRDSRGSLIAVEVTELVSEQHVREAEQGGLEYCEWEYDDVVQKIDAILREKDAKDLRGGPYYKTIVVIHTDEYTIQYDAYAPRLAAEDFLGFDQLDEAYLLFSFDPYQECCPYIKLRLHKNCLGSAPRAA